MAGRTIDRLVEGGSYFEGPRWHDGRWQVSDLYTRTVWSVTPDGRQEAVATVEGQPSGLGWMADGSMLIVSMKDHCLLRRSPLGSLDVVADLTAYCGGHLNDLVVDAEGRAFVGNFGFDLMNGGDPKPASLVRVDPDGTATVVAEELYFPNGSVITPDGGTLIVCETLACRYTAFAIGPGGALTDRRVWAELAPTPAFGSFAETLPQVTVAPDG